MHGDKQSRMEESRCLPFVTSPPLQVRRIGYPYLEAEPRELSHLKIQVCTLHTSDMVQLQQVL